MSDDAIRGEQGVGGDEARNAVERERCGNCSYMLSMPMFHGGLVYLASPYTHRDADVMHMRYLQALAVARCWVRLGVPVYTPVVYGHTVGIGDWDYWMRHCIQVLKKCRVLVVLRLNGWDTSRGVQDELAEATRRSIPIRYQEYDLCQACICVPDPDGQPYCEYLHYGWCQVLSGPDGWRRCVAVHGLSPAPMGRCPVKQRVVAAANAGRKPGGSRAAVAGSDCVHLQGSFCTFLHDEVPVANRCMLRCRAYGARGQEASGAGDAAGKNACPR
jgi:hypothetical protein